MMRKKTAIHLDGRYVTMIENAFYYSNPPEVKQETKKERPPMKEYIRRLIYKDLSKVTTEKVQIYILKLPQKRCKFYILKLPPKRCKFIY